MRHFGSLLFGNILSFWFLADVPAMSRLQPEPWQATYLCALVLTLFGFVIGECAVEAWHSVRA